MHVRMLGWVNDLLWMYRMMDGASGCMWYMSSCENHGMLHVLTPFLMKMHVENMYNVVFDADVVHVLMILLDVHFRHVFA